MENMFRLDGKVALVTGASAGLGKRFAAVLAAAGAKVALCARRTDKLASLANEIAAAGGTAFPMALDVTNVAAIRACVESVEAELGTLDILVNNSGTEVQKRVADYEEADYDLVMNTNAKGAFFVAQAVGRRMIAAGRPGRIINIASAIGLRIVPHLAIYGMSKAAMMQMTKSMAHEWTRHRICVNAICPGYIETEMNTDYWESEGGRKLLNRLPGRRVGRPEDLDGLLLLLASDHSHFINGAMIAIDDGLAVG